MFSLSKETRENDALKASIRCALSNTDLCILSSALQCFFESFISFDREKIHRPCRSNGTSNSVSYVHKQGAKVEGANVLWQTEVVHCYITLNCEVNENRWKNYFLNAFASRSLNKIRCTPRRTRATCKERNEKRRKKRASPARFLHILFWHL